MRHEGKLLRTRVIEILETETHEVELVVVPAANIAGDLVCSDEGPLPGNASFVALDVRHDLARLDEKQILEAAALRLDYLRLGGERRDRFRAGPLEEGFYHVALRPAGHDRWTWALGTERAEDAATIQGVSGEPTKVGVIEIDCGPVILLEPKVVDDRPLPDLRGVTPGGRVAQVSGNVTNGDTRREVSGVAVESFLDHVLLRGLPEGDVDLHVVLINEYFLPEPRLKLRVEANLERGRTLTLAPLVAGIGGRLVLLDLGEAAAARLTDALGERRLEPVGEARAIFNSLPAGEYDVEVCADPDCEDTATPVHVTIVPLRTLELSPTPPGAAR